MNCKNLDVSPGWWNLKCVYVYQIVVKKYLKNGFIFIMINVFLPYNRTSDSGPLILSCGRDLLAKHHHLIFFQLNIRKERHISLIQLLNDY